MSIPTTVRQMVLKVMFNLMRKETEKANALFNAFDLDGIFMSDQSFSPWKRYSEIEGLQKPLKFLKGLQEAWLNKISSIPAEGRYADEIKTLKEQIQIALKEQKFPDEDRLPEFVPSRSQNKLDCATHLQKQTQSQKQTETESEAKTQVGELRNFRLDV